MAIGEVLTWLLFVALLVPAGFVGWVIGHYAGSHGGTRTVTVTASAPATTTAPAPATTTTAPPKTTTAAASTASPAKAVFVSAGCGACHTFTLAGTHGKVGPDLNTAPKVDAAKDKMALAAFVKQSIVDPNAYISPGFPKGVMPATFAKTLSTAKIDALVAFIVSGAK